MGSLSASIRTWKTWTVMPTSVLYLVGLGTNETGRSAVDYTGSNRTNLELLIGLFFRVQIYSNSETILYILQN